MKPRDYFWVVELNVKSRPARGAWIETIDNLLKAVTHVVAPRTGRVD